MTEFDSVIVLFFLETIEKRFTKNDCHCRLFAVSWI